MTHELTIKQNSEKEAKKRKIVDLKSIAQNEEESEELEERKEDDDMVLITYKFRRFMRKKKQSLKRKPFSKDDPSKEKVKKKKYPICYECRKLRHLKIDSLFLKKSSKKINKKVMSVLWSDSNDSSFEEKTQEEANLYLMT